MRDDKRKAEEELNGWGEGGHEGGGLDKGRC